MGYISIYIYVCITNVIWHLGMSEKLGRRSRNGHFQREGVIPHVGFSAKVCHVFDWVTRRPFKKWFQIVKEPHRMRLLTNGMGWHIKNGRNHLPRWFLGPRMMDLEYFGWFFWVPCLAVPIFFVNHPGTSMKEATTFCILGETWSPDCEY